MKEIRVNHYVDTAIYSVDIIIRTLKMKLKQKIDKLGMGITCEQFVVLDTIRYYENIYQQKLSEILMKDKSNTTRIIKVLESKGLISRVAGNSNNRLVYLLTITAKGKQLADENMPKIKKIITDIFENITDEELDTLHTLSKKFQSDLFKISDTEK